MLIKGRVLPSRIPGITGEPEYIARPKGTVVFSREIAPIPHIHCAPCHRAGQAAPFPLLSYDDARKHAAEIGEVTESGYMPPWLPVAGYGHFIDERRLTPGQKGLLLQWVREGAREGDPRETPPPPDWPGGWFLGKPDLVVTMPHPFPLTPEGADVYRNFVVPMNIDRDRYVRAVEFRPVNQRIVHHAFIKVSSNGAGRSLDRDPVLPGFEGMEVPAETPVGQFLAWQPGKIPAPAPDGLPWTLKRGSDLLLQVHMNRTGKPETLQSSVGLYFTDQPPTNTCFKMELVSLAIDLSPGVSNTVISDSFQLPANVKVLAVLPHAHFLAREIKGWASLPDGTVRWLLWIQHWDFKWQGDYRYSDPVPLPAGSVLHMEWTYDNSDQNPSNPNHPPRRVGYGPQSSDEMAELWFQLLPARTGDLALLEEGQQRHLWSVVLAQCQQLLKRNPKDARAHDQMGKYLLSQNQKLRATGEFRQAIVLNPDLDDPHLQLGMLLRFQGRLLEAKSELETALRLNPANARAYGHLGFIAADRGDAVEAERCFRKTLELDPGDNLVADALKELRQIIQQKR